MSDPETEVVIISVVISAAFVGRETSIKKTALVPVCTTVMAVSRARPGSYAKGRKFPAKILSLLLSREPNQEEAKYWPQAEGLFLVLWEKIEAALTKLCGCKTICFEKIIQCPQGY